MSKIYVLIKILFKNQSGTQSMNIKSLPISQWIGLFVFLGMLGIVALKIIPVVVLGMYELFSIINQQQDVVNLGISIITILIFRTGISVSFKAFYSTKEIDSLLPLPLKFYEILSAKFIWILISQFVAVILLLVPVLVTYGIRASVGVVYWINSILVVLMISIVPTVIAALISIAMLRVTNIGKYKEKLKSIAILMSIGISIMLSMVLPRDIDVEGKINEVVSIFAFGKQVILGFINLIVPTTKWATYSLIGTSNTQIYLNLILLVLVSIGSVVVFLIGAQNLYFKGVVGSSESFAKKEKLNTKEFNKSTNESSKFKAYTLKEIKMLARNPFFLASCIGVNLIFPIFILGYFIANGNSTLAVKDIYTLLTHKDILGIVIGVIFGSIVFIAGSNVLASTAVSREGQNMYINKYIPMSYKEQIFGKILSAMIINMISNVFIALIFIFILKIPISMAIFIIISTIIVNIIGSVLGLMIDINKPKLVWDDEFSLLKQNINNFTSSIISFLIGGLSIFLSIKFKPSLIVVSIYITVFLLVTIIGMGYYISIKGEKLYSKIE